MFASLACNRVRVFAAVKSEGCLEFDLSTGKLLSERHFGVDLRDEWFRMRRSIPWLQEDSRGDVFMWYFADTIARVAQLTSPMQRREPDAGPIEAIPPGDQSETC